MRKSDHAEMHVIDICELWKPISAFAISEDSEKYVKKVDEYLNNVPDSSAVVFVGKSPIWLYGLVLCRVIHKRPDINLFYSKPTSAGHRKYKIYPW